MKLLQRTPKKTEETKATFHFTLKSQKNGQKTRNFLGKNQFLKKFLFLRMMKIYLYKLAKYTYLHIILV